MEAKICRNCGKSFIPKVGNQVYCNECKTGYDTCPVCGKKKKILNEFCSNSCQTKYRVSQPGYVNPGTRPEVKEKIKRTFVEHYGTTSPWLNKEFRESYEEKQIERRGYAYPFQSDEIQEKVKKSNLETLGVEYPAQSPEVQEKIKGIFRTKYGGNSPYTSDEVREAGKRTMLEKYGREYYCLEAQKCLKGPESKPNLKFKEYLERAGISFEREVIYGGRAFDFKIGHTLVEINPSATHNTSFEIFGKRKVDPEYHIKKTKIAEENNLRCIHVWDWDSFEVLSRLLGNRETVYARNCNISEVSKGVAKEFLETNHLQGSVPSILNIGLFYNNELVMLMAFGKPRYNKNYQWELLRLCSSKNIIGGTKKLWNYFLENFTPDSVISYCDKSKFTGKVYFDLGFDLVKSGKPSKHWYNLRTKQHITDNLLRQLGADKLIGTNYGKGTSNEDILIEHGFVCIYDCGQDSYVWKPTV